jgi:hypothetical protein
MLIRVTAAAIFIIAGLCGLSPVIGQILSGRVIDAVTGEPLSGAALMIDETTIGTATASNGTFSIPLSDVPAVLVVSHLSYQTTRITLTSNSPNTLEIFMAPESHDLGTVNIQANSIVEILKGTSWEVLDFEFLEDDLLLMANENGNMYKPSLLLVSLNGDTLSSLRVDRPGEFYRDFEGNIYYLNSRSAWKVSTASHNLHIDYVMGVEEFLNTYPAVVDLQQPWWILKQYTYNKLVLSYYRYNERDSSVNLFCSVSNQPGIARSQRGPYFDDTPADRYFASMIMNRPVQAPLYRWGEAFLMFNFTDKYIENFDPEGNSLFRIHAEFMKDKNTDGLIYKDDVTGKFYTSTAKNGITSILSIDPKSGTAAIVAQIPKFVYVENIVIRDGEAFFLYKDKFREEQKKIYRMKV